ncbi:MAG: DUF11 domain-containing protein [Blastocatellia bacterium]|nr:DUF11 domain-containing protein [Blastocatellia bacterium]
MTKKRFLSACLVATVLVATPLTARSVQPGGPNPYDLTIEIEGSPEPVGSGEQLTLTITVVNTGAGLADPVLVQSATPAGTTFASIMSTNGLTTHPDVGATGPVECTARNLESGDSVVVELVVDVVAEPGSTIEAAAAAVGPDDENSDANPDDNSAETAIPVRVDGASIDLAVDVEPYGDEAGTDSPFEFDVVVTNLSEDTTAVGVVLTTSTPDGTTFSDADAFGEITSPEPGDQGDIICMFEAIEPGESEVLTVTLDVIGPAGGEIDFEASAVSASDDPNPDDNSAAVSVPIVEADEFTLDWDEPDFGSGADLPPPRNLVVIEGAAAKAFVDRVSATNRAASPRNTLVGYNIYRATRPGETPSPGNFYQSVPATVTSSTSPAAPAGTFFVVTAQYDDGESNASNEASAEVPAAVLTSVKVKSSKIVADGTGFSATVQVFVDGIPFATAAKLKKGGTRVIQKGGLISGVSLATYLGGHPSVLITFRNENGGVAAYRHP